MRALKVNENINLNEVFVLTEAQAKTRYNIGRNNLLRVADEAGAVTRVGTKKKGYVREILDGYFMRHTE